MGSRLSNEDIDNAVSLGCAATLEDVFAGEDILGMAREIQERRAADLTADEVAALRHLIASLDGEPRTMRTAIAKILSAHGA